MGHVAGALPGAPPHLVGSVLLFAWLRGPEGFGVRSTNERADVIRRGYAIALSERVQHVPLLFGDSNAQPAVPVHHEPIVNPTGGRRQALNVPASRRYDQAMRTIALVALALTALRASPIGE